MTHYRARMFVRALAVAAGLGVTGLAGPAGAHPFGDPQQLDINAVDTGYEVVWQAADDDITSLALRLDVLDGPRATVFENGAEVPSYIDDADAEKLAASPVLERYLVSRIELAVDDEPCEGQLSDASDLATSGARLTYTCAQDGDALTVHARTLTDLHAAYRTMATGPGGATHVFGIETETHDFPLDGTGPTATDAGVELIAWASGGVAVLAGGAAVVRLRKRRTS